MSTTESDSSSSQSANLSDSEAVDQISDNSDNDTQSRSETEDLNAQQSGKESLEFSSEAEFECSSEDSNDGYGGRGDPEAQRKVYFLLGDVVEFSQDGETYFGEVTKVDPDYIQLEHKDKNIKGQYSVTLQKL